MTAVLVIAGAMVGAPLRYLADRAVQARHGGPFPWGTLLVNLAGCVVLGGLAGAGAALPAPLFALLGTGFCGALTTYSTFSYETLRLVEQKAHFYAAMNIVLSVAAGVGGAYVGFAAVQAFVAV
ncbi:fluoride efflux transporter CrcB [Amycolatopsis methanolica]|uniref:Fluoride-specific ion channel FluC n=1 Tax=Amycolatopsis methanolica 239 TaxID=1068978 RepID=A0A076N1W5_AMYME|nr:fluoride efflux transporter CrcB [Amycolatopsis methanolica]AIJ26828.1 camphor resistance protein CrcB [Amycolatopsis methanolica 239]